MSGWLILSALWLSVPTQADQRCQAMCNKHQMAKHGRAGLALAVSNSAQTNIRSLTSVTAGLKALYVDRKKAAQLTKGKVSKLLKENHNPNSYLILPLYVRLKDAATYRKKLHKWKPNNPPFTKELQLWLHRTTPYRLLSEIMYTAGQTGFSYFHFVTCSTDPSAQCGPRAMLVCAPSLGKPQKTPCSQAYGKVLTTKVSLVPAKGHSKRLDEVLRNKTKSNKHKTQKKRRKKKPLPMPALNLTVSIDGKGIVVWLRGNKLSRGCSLSAKSMNHPQKTLPTFLHKGKRVDTKGLTNCLRNIKKRFPRENRIILMAAPKIPYQRIVEVMDAARAFGTNKPMYPHVIFSVGVL